MGHSTEAPCLDAGVSETLGRVSTHWSPSTGVPQCRKTKAKSTLLPQYSGVFCLLLEAKLMRISKQTQVTKMTFEREERMGSLRTAVGPWF